MAERRDPPRKSPKLGDFFLFNLSTSVAMHCPQHQRCLPTEQVYLMRGVVLAFRKARVLISLYALLNASGIAKNDG